MNYHNIIICIFSILLLSLLSACEEKVPEEVMLSQDKPYLEVATNNRQLSFIAKGGTQSIEVKSNVDWNVDAPTWIVCSPQTGGMNDETLTITVDENPTNTQRSENIMIRTNYTESVTISVTQAESIIVPNENDNVLPKQK